MGKKIRAADQQKQIDVAPGCVVSARIGTEQTDAHDLEMVRRISIAQERSAQSTRSGSIDLNILTPSDDFIRSPHRIGGLPFRLVIIYRGSPSVSTRPTIAFPARAASPSDRRALDHPYGQ